MTPTEHAFPSPEPAAEDRGRDGVAAFRQAKIHADRLEFDAARLLVTKAIELAPLYAPAHHLHGLILQEQGDLDGALIAFRRSVYADPGFALGHFGSAGLLARSDRKARALKALENVDRSVEDCSADAHVDGGDGLTVKRLRELVAAQREMWR